MKKPFKIIISISAGVLLLVIIGIILINISGPKKKDFIELVNPRIIKKENIKSIKVHFEGDPEVVIEQAFGKLFKTYYSLKGVPKFNIKSAPVARYEGFNEIITSSDITKFKEIVWKGYAAIPIPDSIIALPEDVKNSPYPAVLETLDYGMVAEIVHFGKYEDEMPAIEKLKDFIKDQGYEISGLHEEEYIKGPGTPFTSPKKFITIIRYQVKKK